VTLQLAAGRTLTNSGTFTVNQGPASASRTFIGNL
jgi:hypothetical protein